MVKKINEANAPIYNEQWISKYNEFIDGFTDYIYNEFGENYFPNSKEQHIKRGEYCEMPCIIIHFAKGVSCFVNLEEWIKIVFERYKDNTLPIYYQVYYVEDDEVAVRFMDRR